MYAKALPVATSTHASLSVSCLLCLLSVLQVAQALNNNIIGGKKRNFYHDDMWNLKYLKGFRWDHLTEKFAYERRVREAKLRAGMIEVRAYSYAACQFPVVYSIICNAMHSELTCL